jgi:iturin family lipopeptide synthetase B
MEELDKRNIEDVLALTPMQEGMLFHYLKDPTSDYCFLQWLEKVNVIARNQ